MSKIDPKQVELEMWEQLLLSPNWKIIDEYIGKRTVLLNKQMVEEAESANADTSNKLLALQIRINELSTFLKRVDFIKSEIIKNKEKHNG